MTDQPTTWTPERALAMLSDWLVSPIALEALESAAAEIERQKARADAAEHERDAETARATEETMRADAAEQVVDQLRAELAAKQSAEAEAAQQGPSDEEMDRIDHLVYCADPSKIQQWMDRYKGESEADYVKRKTFEALQAMAKRLRRAGVRL